MADIKRMQSSRAQRPSKLRNVRQLKDDPLIAFALVNVVLGLIPFLVVPALRR
ncbi:hypothetical protein JQ604_17105 [Bradyrhizobium jicamae]|uniref:hypothetical protein n=1 Tax=Bradyrhizobium jicamae TaxID=280332 RepID=UPI001BAD06DD|nr:hypothetical protein [Bradyrhizobium jicamae]MBR0753905.1 hypothetical protein [Bradyrhizobium jicamae]